MCKIPVKYKESILHFYRIWPKSMSNKIQYRKTYSNHISNIILPEFFLQNCCNSKIFNVCVTKRGISQNRIISFIPVYPAKYIQIVRKASLIFYSFFKSTCIRLTFSIFTYWKKRFPYLFKINIRQSFIIEFINPTRQRVYIETAGHPCTGLIIIPISTISYVSC